jgi:very-short-patch-repair endonuclease
MKKYPSDGAHERAKALRREMTEAEKKIWNRLRSRQAEGYRFRRQVQFGPFIADFACHEAKLIVEIDLKNPDGVHTVIARELGRITPTLPSRIEREGA